MQETWAWSPDWENSLEKEMVTHSSILAWGNSMDRGAWWATVHVVTESDTTDRLTISLSLFTFGRSHAIHAISQYFKCEYTSSEFRSICAFVHWVELVAILVPNVWLCHQICLMEPFILWDSFLRESLIHSLMKELVKSTIIHFFSVSEKSGGVGETHHTIATFLQRAFMSYFFSFPHTVSSWDSIRLTVLLKETMLCSLVFLCQCSEWQAVSQSHWEAFDIVEIFMHGRKLLLVHSHGQLCTCRSWQRFPK